MQENDEHVAGSGRGGAGDKQRPHVAGWFDEHPLFLGTSEAATGPGRLNMRHQALIEDNADILAGARVLDIASHDGRWALAALEAGAAHVTGIEARPELVEKAHMTFAHYGADRSRYRLVASDIFAALSQEHLDVDVIQCFGFLYHTLRYPELFSRLRRLEPRHLLLDTRVHRAKGAVIRVYVNESTVQTHATADDYTERTKTVVGSPTAKALRKILRVYGFSVEREYDWKKAGRNTKAAIGTYQRGRRISWRCSWRTPHQDDGQDEESTGPPDRAGNAAAGPG